MQLLYIAKIINKIIFNKIIITDYPIGKSLKFNLIKEYQLLKLKKICEYAYKNIDMYKCIWDKNGFDPKYIKQFNDIIKIPIITKKDLQDYYPNGILQKRSQLNYKSGNTELSTSGSSGSPVKIFASNSKILNEISLMSSVCISSLINHSSRIKTLVITDGDEVSFEAQGEKFFKFLKNNHMDMSQSEEDYIKRILDKKFNCILTYAGIINNICTYCLENNINMLNTVKLILTSSQPLEEETILLVKAVFGEKVILGDVYAATETGFIGIKTDRNAGFKTIGWKCIVEIIDDNNLPVPEEKSGRIIVSDLTNYATPIIRYSGLNDFATLKSNISEWGGIILDKIEGRISDSIETKSGEKIHPFKFCWLEKIPNLDQYQIIQTELNEFIVKIKYSEKDSNISIDPNLSNEINKRFKSLLGDDIKVEVQYVKDIKNPRLSKKKAIIIGLNRFKKIKEDLIY